MRDIGRIALVTRRFTELQGLIPAAFGASLILATLMAHAIGAPAQSAGAFPTLVFASMFFWPSTQFLQRMYRRTFGDAVATTYQKMLGAMPVMVVMIGGLLDLNFYQLQAHKQGPSFAAIALASYSTWVLLRDWRWRIHHVVSVVAGLTGVMVTASVSPSPGQWGIDPARAEAFLLAYTLTGLGLVITGLFDHYILASALRRAGSEEVSRRAAARVESRQGLQRASFTAPFCAAGGICVFGFTDRGLALSLPLALMLATMAAIILAAVSQIPVGIRQFNKRPIRPDDGPTVNFRPESLVLIVLMALAAVIDSTLLPQAGPVVLTIAIGLSSAWVAVRGGPGCQRYLLGTALAAAVLFFIPRVEPARAFALLVFAVAGGVTLGGLFDFVANGMRAVNVDTI